MNLLLKTPTKTKFLRIKWREINDRTCEKPHKFSLLLSYPNTVTSHMIEGKFLTNCTYMSIMISFRKTPSAKSVIDSMRALPLKVLFAYRDEKKSLDKTEFTIARCKVISLKATCILHRHTICKHWTHKETVKLDESKILLTQTTSGLWRNPSAVAMVLHDRKTANTTQRNSQ